MDNSELLHLHLFLRQELHDCLGLISKQWIKRARTHERELTIRRALGTVEVFLLERDLLRAAQVAAKDLRRGL